MDSLTDDDTFPICLSFFNQERLKASMTKMQSVKTYHLHQLAAICFIHPFFHRTLFPSRFENEPKSKIASRVCRL